MCIFSGPFIVMLGNMLADVVKFCFLYLQFFIPFGKSVLKTEPRRKKMGLRDFRPGPT